MSFNILRIGTKLGGKPKPVLKEENISSNTNTGTNNDTANIENIETQIFPDCSKTKEQINTYKKMIKKIENSDLTEKLKLKKFEMIKEKLGVAREALIEQLNINSPHIDDIDPLCSFEEMGK